MLLKVDEHPEYAFLVVFFRLWPHSTLLVKRILTKPDYARLIIFAELRGAYEQGTRLGLTIPPQLLSYCGISIVA